jgi:serine protease Do
MFPRAASKILSVSLLAFAAAGLGPPAGAAENAVADAICSQVGKVFQERRSAVVKVRSSDGLGIRFGSGFFADPTGLIFTHAGIVTKADSVNVLFDGRDLPARVLVADERSGVAILKVDASTPAIPIGDSEKVTMATPLVLIGYPQDLDASPSFGIVAALDKKHLGRYFSTTHIRANLPVSRGEGGAPVLNLDGEAVGILVGRVDSGAACHILPIRAAEKVRSDLVRFGELRPAWVGVEVEDASSPVGGSTAVVGALSPETPAARSGLEPGDVLLKIGSTPITTSEDVIDASFFLTAGDDAAIEILRDGARRSLSVRPALHPLARGHEMQATVLPDETLHLD